MLALLRSIFVVATLAAVLIQGQPRPPRRRPPAARASRQSRTGRPRRRNATPAERQAGLQWCVGSPVRAGHDGDNRNPALQKGPKELPLTRRPRKHEELRPGEGWRLHGHVHALRVDAVNERALPDPNLSERQHIAFLFEVSTWFHVVPFRNEHPKEIDATWFGNSIAKWDGDTLIVDTVGFNGYTRLDTVGRPHSDKLHLTQKFKHIDAGHVTHSDCRRSGLLHAAVDQRADDDAIQW